MIDRWIVFGGWATDAAILSPLFGNAPVLIDAGDADHHYHTSATLPPVDASSLHSSIKNGVLEVTFRCLPGTAAET